MPTVTRRLELDDLYRIPVLSDPQLSPDGARVAFVVTRADRDADEHRSTIWTVGVDGGEPVPLTAGPRDSSPRWSPDRRWLAFVSAHGDGEKRQIWLLPIAGGEASRLTHEPAGSGEPTWSPDGSRVAFTATVEPDGFDDTAPVVVRRLGHKGDGAGLGKGRQRHVFVVAAVPGAEARQLTSGAWSAGDLAWSPNGTADLAWSPDGTALAFAAATGSDADLELISHVYVVDVDSGTLRQVTQHRGTAAAPAFTPDGTTIVFAGKDRVGVGHTRLYRVAAAGGIPEAIAPEFDRNVMVGAPAYPGACPAVIADGTAVVFCARDRGCTNVFTVPLAGGVPRRIIGDGDSVIAGLSHVGGRLAYVESDSRTCGEIGSAATDGSGARRLTRVVADGLLDVELFTPAARTFHAADGTEIHGWVTTGERADGARAGAPLLLDIHGGPHNAWSPVFDGVHLYHQVLAAAGWTILTINPRGSDGYGEACFTALLKDGWGRADAGDFLAALDAVIEHDGIDPRRIAVTGYSYGGYMTNWLTAHSDRFAAAISGGCVTNLVSMASADIGPVLDAHELGATPWNDPQRLVDVSPLTYVARVTTPTLILHGEDDSRCPVGQAEEWFAALRGRRQEVELVRYPGASHEFILSGRPSHRIDYCQRVADWAARHCATEIPFNQDSSLKSP
jgi:dipeptidyl aminopeptidase/acylaminoacyl peptidase